MNTFFSKVADYLYDNYKNDISKLCLVLPNRRAGLFLKTSISKKFQKTIWSPEIFATEDFIKNLSGLQIIDSTAVLFKFYKIYRKKEGEKAQSFDEFIKWAQIILSDYNEIDSYFINTEELFEYINENRALEVWNVSGEELTEVQKNYLRFWDSFGKYYQELKQELLENNQAYQGLAFRIVAENVLEKLNIYEQKNETYKKIIFIGFNALNDSEEKIIKTLLNNQKAEILWDSDAYYLNNNIQEAGKFLRKHRFETKLFDLEKNENWIENLLSSESKNINIIGVPNNIGQAKVAGEILSKSDKSSNYQNTALVLADENLLMPVLNSIPDDVTAFNVTMGYPLKKTPLFDLLSALLSLHENAFALSKQKSKIRFHHKDLILLISNQYFGLLGDSKKTMLFFKKLKQFLIEKNKIFVSTEQLKKFAEQEQFEDFCHYEHIFQPWGDNITLALNSITELIENLAKCINKKTPDRQALEIEFLYNFSKAFKQIQNFEDEFKAIKDLKTLRLIYTQLLSAKTIAFYGEPLKGLQIMGMLETRNLDFENLILISVNEGIIPAGKSSNSFIPYEIKLKFKLPTHTEKDAIFAYHFYRLIQRSKNITLLFNTQTDEFGSGEKSRFISQLLNELPQHNNSVIIKEQLYTLPALKNIQDDITITKSEEINDKLQKMASSGFSPSALNTYLRCPLDFYYKYLLELKDEKEVEETIEANTLGTFIHEVLETLYKPFEGKILESDKIGEMKNQVESLTRNAFLKKYDASDIDFGKNKLIITIAQKYIQNFLDSEKSFLESIKKENAALTIVALEKSLFLSKTILINGKEIEVNFKGKADRIDRINNRYRIIDYKTGNVDDKDTKINDLEDVLEKEKSLQLLLYALLYEREKNILEQNQEIQSGIFSLRKSADGLYSVNINKNESIKEEQLAEFEIILEQLIANIFDLNTSFVHKPEAEYCSFCNSIN